MSRVAVLAGGQSLERQVSLRSAGRVRDALEQLGHEGIAIDVGPDLVDRLADTRPDVAFIALHGRDGEDGSVQEILELMGVAYTASGASACMRCMDKVLTKHALRDAGLPTPDFYSFSQTAFQSLGAGLALPTIEERLDFPVVVKPAAQGSALGIRFAATAADVPAAIVAAFSYDTKVLLERHVAGRDLPISILDGVNGPEALPIVEAIPRDGDHYDFEARYEIGRTTSSPSRARARSLPSRAGARARCLSRAWLLRIRAHRPDALERRGGTHRSRGRRDSGLHRDVAVTTGGRGGGHLVRRDRAAGPGPRVGPCTVLESRRALRSGPERTSRRRGRLVAAALKVLRRHLVEELLELVHDFFRVLDLVLELDRRLRDHVLRREDRSARPHC